ncbi:hypothetical protein [Streptomyces griseomycini]|uniref:Uncharacterized protein n=1 Tax=Streptomyces griseomycini TaxID=66895 RepID=A0A7W7LVJ9_9ACTN|nr:hypothetical protein [Streptomyces griseomycini]MBB4897240.1 hypothetical protein [Streptomyces griseomycini]GGR33733.1 hypothetical protein GCM10015536_44150 [Streptomyces griseomycini]
MGLEATYVDFSVDPIRLSNAEVARRRVRFSGSRLATDLEVAVQSPAGTARTLTAPAARLRDG